MRLEACKLTLEAMSTGQAIHLWYLPLAKQGTDLQPAACCLLPAPSPAHDSATLQAVAITRLGFACLAVLQAKQQLPLPLRPYRGHLQSGSAVLVC